MSPTTKNTTALIHPDVLRAITRTLRSFGVHRQDLEEGVAEVQTRTLEYLRGKPHPATVEEWKALCVTVARHWRMDEKKKQKTERKYCEGLCEDPDQRTGLEPGPEGREVLDARRMVEALRVQLEAGEMPEKAEEILDCVQAGMSCPEAAADLGITAEAVRMRLRRVRQAFDARPGALDGPTAPPSPAPVPPPRGRRAA
jgi:DNA-directed RNA polymerase specialized sigma24 family protein